MTPNLKKPKVLISVPNTGWIHKIVGIALLRLIQDNRVAATIIMPSHNPYENNLNHIAKDFVNGEYDFWLNIDSDNPPLNNPIDLVFLDLDMVALPTPQCHIDKNHPGERPYYWVACNRVEGGYKEHQNKSGLQEVDAVGSGCMLISRRVLLRIKKPFERIYDEDGCVTIGADFNFCRKVKEAGFKIHVNYNYPCQHFKEVEMIEMIKAFEGVHRG